MIRSLILIAGCLWCSGLWAASVDVTLLTGARQSGELQALSADTATIAGASGVVSWPVKELQSIEFTSQALLPPEALAGVGLLDGTSLLVSSGTFAGGKVEVTPVTVGALSIPSGQAAWLRLLPLDDTISAGWQDLLNRRSRDDLVVIRKGDVLDYVAGSVARVTPEQVVILVRGKELAAPRERVFGVIFAAPESAPDNRGIAVHLVTGELLKAQSLALSGETLRVTTAAAGVLEVPLGKVRLLDYGGGRVRMLASLPFDQSSSKSPDPKNEVVWFVSTNSPSGSGGRLPLAIGKSEFRQGLWLHSGAELRFRLNREFTKLRATAGIELTHAGRMPRFEPKVKFTILGDGRELFAREFNWNDEPQPLDVDLTDVRELVLKVESLGKNGGILEHFALGDAQVIQ